MQGREADEAGQVTRRSVDLRANLERFSDAETNWLRDLASKGFVLVPVSAIVKERGGEG